MKMRKKKHLRRITTLDKTNWYRSFQKYTLGTPEETLKKIDKIIRYLKSWRYASHGG